MSFFVSGRDSIRILRIRRFAPWTKYRDSETGTFPMYQALTLRMKSLSVEVCVSARFPARKRRSSAKESGQECRGRG
jgi:hypothetical protein